MWLSVARVFLFTTCAQVSKGDYLTQTLRFQPPQNTNNSKKKRNNKTRYDSKYLIYSHNEEYLRPRGSYIILPGTIERHDNTIVGHFLTFFLVAGEWRWPRARLYLVEGCTPTGDPTRAPGDDDKSSVRFSADPSLAP